MILFPLPEGAAAILQSAHAAVAFQIADHWGNRAVPRPSPRADVLVAALLHDAGWDGREEPPRLAPDGSPEAFDTLDGGEREPVWTASVERASVRGRYAAYLVSHHVTHLADTYSRGAHPGFLAREEARREALRASLAGDPRYAGLFRTGADAVNRAIIRLTDAVAVLLATGCAARVELPGLPLADGEAALEMRPVGERAYRLRPWPLTGRRLKVHADARMLPARRFPDEAALRTAWAGAATVRLTWSLLAPGEPLD